MTDDRSRPGAMVGAGRTGEGRPRTLDEPAPTITGKRTAAWLASPDDYDRGGGHSVTESRDPERTVMRQNANANATVRAASEPAPTITAGHDALDRVWEELPDWPGERPATTVVGSFRPDVIAAPGYRKAGDGPRQNAPESVSVSVSEAALLQSFPEDYPWQGSRTAIYKQIGNAVPVLLAEAVWRAALDLDGDVSAPS